ncbi:hypothetical protein GQ54DRAFT_298149 [Martensiomyces pterosporus]|nr:hypothetical protein GQ54DRAFT_298149 [Martensiomyces pterosporus]
MAVAGSGIKRDIVSLASANDVIVSAPNLLPCSIKHDGPAKTSAYFLVSQQGDTTYEASFRGRRLCGRSVTLPDNYTGHVVLESVTSQEAQDTGAFEVDSPAPPPAEQRELRSVGQFSSLVVWEHDRVPLDDDEFTSSLEWIDVAKSIHADCSTGGTNV